MNMRTECQSAGIDLKKDGRTKLATERSSAPGSQLNDKQQFIYINALFGALDGLSISYSMIRCFFDMLCVNSDCSPTDLMHDWMMTPTGIAIAVAESAAIIGLSLIANIFEDDDKNHHVNRFIVLYWPYFRDAFKALKNTYRSIRSALQVFSTLTGHDIRYLALPIGIGLGILSMMNRAVVRYFRSQRSSMLKANRALLKTIQDSLSLSPSECQEKLNQILSEKLYASVLSFFAAFYSGFVDGIYLYMGVLSLASLAPSFFIIAVSLSVSFSLLCIASRMYEIYNEQRELELTQAKIKLALCGQELQILCLQLQWEFKKAFINEEERRQRDGLANAFYLKLHAFEENRTYMHSLVTSSYLSSVFAGLRGGLAAYGVIASLMFAIATVTTLMYMSFPPALVITCVIAGLACLITTYLHEQARTVYPLQCNGKLSQLLESMYEGTVLKPIEIRTIINEAMGVDSTPQVLYQERFEIWRSFFSGLGKGQKPVDFTLFMLQEQDQQGHYHDTPLMFGVMAVNSMIYAAVLAKRAHMSYERAVNQNKESNQPLQAWSTFIQEDVELDSLPLFTMTKNDPGNEQPRDGGESAQRCIPSADSPPRNGNSSPITIQIPAPNSVYPLSIASSFKFAQCSKVDEEAKAIQRREVQIYLDAREKSDTYLTKFSFFSCFTLSFGFSKQEKIMAARALIAYLDDGVPIPQLHKPALSQSNLGKIVALKNVVYEPQPENETKSLFSCI